MASHTLLLITYHFPPSAAVAVYRMLGLVRYLPRCGWNVVVVAPPRMIGEPEDADLLRHIPPETIVYRVPFPDGLAGKAARRAVGNFVWAPRALATCAKAIARHKPAAMLTTSPPPTIHYLGLCLRKRYHLPWLASLRDPWITNRVLPPRRSYIIDRFMEARMIANASAVVANTPLNLVGLKNAYPHHAHKMAAVPNGFEPAWFPPPPSRDGVGARLSLLHAGELYSGRDPRPLFDAIALLEKESLPQAPRWDVRFLGRATEGLFDPAVEIARRNLLGQVEAQAPYDVSLQRMVGADALLLLHTANSRVGVPAKLYEYLGAGRPILAVAEPDGDVAWVLRTSGVLHRLVRPGDVPAMASALRELRDELLAGADRSSPSLYLNPFTRENMARRMASCLDWILLPPRERKPLAIPLVGCEAPKFSPTSFDAAPMPVPVGRIDPLHV